MAHEEVGSDPGFVPRVQDDGGRGHVREWEKKVGLLLDISLVVRCGERA